MMFNEGADVILLRLYFNGCWWVEYPVDCDVVRIAMTFAETMVLEGAL
jgi:hypothetical protein